MKTYDFKKVKEIINENVENLKSASLGMHEDWFWTAEVIWKNGAYLKELPENADEIFIEYRRRRSDGMSILSEDCKQFDNILIGGIYGSSWATPTLQLLFKNDTDKMIPVYKGTSSDPIRTDLLGVLSGPVQDNITPLSKD